MAQTRTIVAVDPATGARFTRRTARNYHAAVIIDTAAGPKAMAWVGRPELAPAQLRKYCAVHPEARLAPVTEDPWAEPAVAAAPVDPARAVADEALAALAELSAEAEDVARPHLPGEPATAPAPSHGATAPKLPDLKGAADKVAALEYLAGGGALSSDVWVALGWPFEAFLQWAQRPDADAREAALRARIRRDGVAASLAHL
jgi:hypothetical protein